MPHSNNSPCGDGGFGFLSGFGASATSSSSDGGVNRWVRLFPFGPRPFLVGGHRNHAAPLGEGVLPHWGAELVFAGVVEASKA